MSRIRTLIVDDSAFVRKVVREMLSHSPDIEIVGSARNGEDALQLAEQLNPDVVTCDLTMPELDGVGFVRRQMARKPVPILLLTASPQDTGRVLDALQAGAVDFVQKPSALANNDLFAIREELVQKVKAAAASPVRSLPLPNPPPPVAPASSPRRATHADILVLGISTGGPQALRYLLPQFPSDFPIPLVIVLHMPLGYTAAFAEKLAEICPLPIQEAYDGCPVQPGYALLAPAGRHLYFKRTAAGAVEVRLSLEPLEKPHRPSVDILFQSAAEVFGKRVLAVVMTGMGDDGLQGAAFIKAQGGTVLTEAEESCVIFGMPRSVVEAGLSDGSVALVSMWEEINKRL
jgi:two-component system chemotaxis response regulator CheB